MVWVECVGGLLDVPHRHAGHQAGVEPAAEQDGQRRIAHEPLDHRVDEGLLRQRGEGEGEGKGGAGGGRLLTWERGGGEPPALCCCQHALLHCAAETTLPTLSHAHMPARPHLEERQVHRGLGYVVQVDPVGVEPALHLTGGAAVDVALQQRQQGQQEGCYTLKATARD